MNKIKEFRFRSAELAENQFDGDAGAGDDRFAHHDSWIGRDQGCVHQAPPFGSYTSSDPAASAHRRRAPNVIVFSPRPVTV